MAEIKGANVMHGLSVEERETMAAERPGAGSGMDVITACRTDVPVLLTGASDVAESVARDIHQTSGWREGPFVVVDCSMGGRQLDALLTWLVSEDFSTQDVHEPAPRRSQSGVIFLRDVNKLSPSAQARVADWLEQLKTSAPPRARRRVISSSATPLVPRGVGGTFDDRLFYRLNLIHIHVDARQE
jgi:DNA-binding NtrC family response regulator